MKKTIKDARAECLVEKLKIQNEMLKSIVIEMLSSSDSYEYERLEGMLLGIEPFITPDNISVEAIEKIMLDKNMEFCKSTVYVESVNNMRGCINARYKKNENDTFESYYTIYFSEMIEKDENFKKLFQ